MHRFEVHSNESECRKSDRLGLEQVSSVLYLKFGERFKSLFATVFVDMIIICIPPLRGSVDY